MTRKASLQVKSIAVVASLVSLPVFACAAGQGDVQVIEEVEVVRKGSTPDAPVQFAVRAGVGYINGEMNEYVYLPEYAGYRLSGLIWNIDNLLLAGIGATFTYKKWLTLAVDGWTKVTDGSGSMDDYDWRVMGYDWSDWSNSDADVTSASIIDANANLTFFRRHNYALRGIVGFKRDHFEMEARGGRFLYSVRTYRDTAGSFPDVPGVSYEQTLSAPYIGVGFNADFSNNIELGGRVIYSPFVEGEATDHHHLRNLVIDDDVSDGNMFAVDFSAGWTFLENVTWDVSVGYQKYDTNKGDSIYHFNDTGEVIEHKNGTGMNQELTRISSGLTYTF